LSAFVTIVPLAFGALRRNRMRSLLTSLGVIIGVSALIAAVASGGSGPSSRSSDADQPLVVLPGSSTFGGARGGPAAASRTHATPRHRQ
jgi:putative ABC transport system permease protein